MDTNSEDAFTYREPQIDRETVTNVTYFEAMKTRHKAFIWPSSSLEPPKKATNNESTVHHYRAGDAILTFNRGGTTLQLRITRLRGFSP